MLPKEYTTANCVMLPLHSEMVDMNVSSMPTPKQMQKPMTRCFMDSDGKMPSMPIALAPAADAMLPPLLLLAAPSRPLKSSAAAMVGAGWVARLGGAAAAMGDGRCVSEVKGGRGGEVRTLRGH